MNQLELFRRRRKLQCYIGRFGPLDDSVDAMCRLMDSLGGWPDVDDWGNSTIREWWHEASDSEEMIEVIRRLGMSVPVYRLDSPDEIRRLVSFADVMRAVEQCVLEKWRW